MASKTRVDLRGLIRKQMDMDAIELPDATIDPWLEDAYEQTLAVEQRWPFFEDEWTFSTVLNQSRYSKAAIAAADPNLYEIDQIAQVLDLTDPLNPVELVAIPHDRARALFGSGAQGGTIPAYYSDFGGSIYLWPAPYGSRSITVVGYRKGRWPALGDLVAVDIDSRLHIALFYFGCAMAYAQQEDDVLSGMYMQRWQAAVRQARASIMSPPQNRPIILGGAMLPDDSVPNVRLVVP